MERSVIEYRPPSKMRRRSTMGICLQLVTSKFWSFLHESIIEKIPSAEVSGQRPAHQHHGDEIISTFFLFSTFSHFIHNWRIALFYNLY